MLDIALLGTGGMMPLPNRFLTSLMFRLNGRFLLIDCGECTQVTLKMLGWGFKNIDIICFTHYHADHISGLPGMLLTIGNSGRTEPLTLIGPKGLKRVVGGLSTIAPELPFDVNIFELPEDGHAEFDLSGYLIKTQKVDHMITCISYGIEVRRTGKFDIEKAQKLDLPKEYWSKLQKNDNVEYNGKIFTSSMVLGEPRKGIKVVYCTDTRPTEKLPEFIRNADLFVCEGMYAEDDKLEKAIEKKHMTFSEAANLAVKGNVSELWLTHFSPSLTDPFAFSSEVCNIFKNTIVGYDRMTKTILFEG